MCKALLLTLHLLSVHSEPGYNNQNWGFGSECRGDRISAGIGAYHNSYDKLTVYGVIGVTLIQAGPVGLDVLMGPASGYKEHTNSVLIGGARVRWSFTERFEAGVFVAPPAPENGAWLAHAVVSWHF